MGPNRFQGGARHPPCSPSVEESVGLEPKSRRTAPASNRAVTPDTFTLQCGQPGTRTLRGWFWRPARALRAAHSRGERRDSLGAHHRGRVGTLRGFQPRKWRRGELNPDSLGADQQCSRCHHAPICRGRGSRTLDLPVPSRTRFRCAMPRWVTDGNRTHDRRATAFRLATWLRSRSTC